MRGHNLLLKAQDCYDDFTAFHREQPPNIHIDQERKIIAFGDMANPKTKIYRPEPTLFKFHNNHDDLLRIIVGAYGSGKSTACCAEVLFLLQAMPFCKDGVRRAKCVIIRNTYSDLATTTLKTWHDWAITTGTYRSRQKPNIVYQHVLYDELGKMELEVLFLALDREQDVRRLESLEVTFAFVNECQHLFYKMFSNLLKRCGRYPSKEDIDMDRITKWYKKMIKTGDGMVEVNSPYYYGAFCDTNPPPTDHWLPRLEKLVLEGERNDTTIYHQPPALLKTKEHGFIINPEAENLTHLPQGAAYYYEMTNETEEFIRVYAQGYYGTVLTGKPVFPQYNDDINSIDTIKPDSDVFILGGLDHGLVCPACLMAQRVNGQVRIIKEFYGEYINVDELAKIGWAPYLSNLKIAYELTDDPANTWHGREQLAKLGYNTIGARTNRIEPRIWAVASLLNMNVNGKPALIISREGCPKLREALLGQYHYTRMRVSGEEKYKDLPEKSHPYSDLMDCLQYIALYFTADATPEEDNETEKALQDNFEIESKPYF